MKMTLRGGVKPPKRTRARPARRAANKRFFLDDPDAIDLDSPRWAKVDWENLPRLDLDFAPALRKRIRARHKLMRITLRVGEEQIAVARRLAKATGRPYQEIMRGWIVAGAKASSRGRGRLASETRRAQPSLVMISRHLQAALRRARYTKLEDGTFCATVAGLRGVIGTGASLEACREDLAEVVEEWILVRVSRGLNIPPLAGARVQARRAG